MAVHTCPRCDLRFELDFELAEHLANDHGVDPDSLAVGRSTVERLGDDGLDHR